MAGGHVNDQQANGWHVSDAPRPAVAQAATAAGGGRLGASRSCSGDKLALLPSSPHSWKKPSFVIFFSSKVQVWMRILGIIGRSLKARCSLDRSAITGLLMWPTTDISPTSPCCSMPLDLAAHSSARCGEARRAGLPQPTGPSAYQYDLQCDSERERGKTAPNRFAGRLG